MELYRLNKKKPILLAFVILLLCSVLRMTEVFVYRFSEEFGGSFFSNFLGLISILLFFNYTKSRIRDIGLSSRRLTDSLPLGIILVFLALFLSYGSQYLFLHLNHALPHFTWNNYTWVQFFLYVLIGNVIASLMEEGLFRGILLRGFMQHCSFLFANSFQAILFGLWHLIWMFKKYTTGQISLKGAFFYSIITGIIGFLMGYIYYLTTNLWISIVWHLIWNLCQSVLAIQSFTYASNSHVMLQSTTFFWLAFIIAAILSMLIMYRRKTLKMQLYINY